MCPAVEALAPRLRPMMQKALELGQRAPIDVALEVDHAVSSGIQ